MGKIAKLLNNPLTLYSYATSKGFTKWVSDDMHLRILYRGKFGAKLDLKNPRSFNEKLQWLKLYDRNPLYTTLVNKYTVKDWVAEKIGTEYVTRTYAKWDKVEEVDISDLPEKFVLKTNHDCGGIVICRDRKTFDFETAKQRLAEHLNRNYFWGGREWPYKNVEPCVFAEEYLESDGLNTGLTDYKFYCFNGDPRLLYISQGLEDHETAHISFLTLDWQFAPFARNDYRPFNELPKKPMTFDKMIEIAKKLSAGIPFVRIDLYEINGKPRFSEITLTPSSGFMPFEPKEWDLRVGALINLDDISKVTY